LRRTARPWHLQRARPRRCTRAAIAAAAAGLLAAGALLAAASAGAAATAPTARVPACRDEDEVARVTAPLRAALAQRRFVTYQPTALQVRDGRATRADAPSIRADLEALRPYFDALVTYDALNGAEQVPAIAARLGFRALVIGVWDPFDEAQVEAALLAARRHPALVVGLSLGNEMLFGRRRGHAELAARIEAIRRRAPGLALSTTEPFHMFLEPRAATLLSRVDFVLANVHPVFEAWFRGAPDANAARFVVEVTGLLAATHCGPVLVKETGVPTAPASSGFTAQRQRGFYLALQREFPPSASRGFAWFSAFDAPWRVADWHPVPGAHPEEAHWGLFDADRRPKPVVAVIPRR
jgi:exo-beta-1,3-glucanase (GH17 family)